MKSLIRWIGYAIACTVTFTTTMVLAKECAPLGERLRSTNSDLLRLVTEDSALCVLERGFQWTEGPVWVDELNGLLFSDIPESKVYLYTEASGVREYLSNSRYSNGLLISPARKLILLQSRNRTVSEMTGTIDKPSMTYEDLATSYHSKRLNSPNDGVFNKKGDLFFTDPPYGLPMGINDPHKELPFQGVFLLPKEGKLTLLESELSFPNGIALALDESYLVVAISDKQHKAWYKLDLDSDNAVTKKTLIHEHKNVEGKVMEGMPDGLVFHSNGLLFATGPGGLFVFDTNLILVGHISIPNITSNVAFDSSFKTLYITANDTLMSLTLD